ncbi:iron permease FTR1 [Trametes versicolor FP-101664 SS1]|uniref:iron permease FTR1 n=1 Tax=Trametes versicolor (strain FP-101664) TaxID=717944 RepID=UPI0004623032|nr:iron permease FTR1 [Trametes versicolor FP-101664 SS1]EIW55590.1 iron permease FTR1 [Trametes versicolor FP-101664 SS1]
MPRNVFSVPIFFIVFRETLEAAIIVSVLLGLVEQIVHEDPSLIPGAVPPAVGTLTPEGENEKRNSADNGSNSAELPQLSAGETAQADHKRLLRKMRIYIFSGAFLGLFLALAIGAAFIAVWFTQASDLWAKSEELWEGIFELVASLIIFVMGVSMLKMDRAKAKWRVKLQRAFSGKAVDKGAKTGKYVLFILPLITVLREGMEAVVFVGGVSLGQPATAIPIAAIVGLICGLICGYLIYAFASRTTLTIFMVVMTNFLLLIGAGLFSKAVWAFQTNAFNHLLGADVDDAGGDGPGSYDVRGSVWHLDCCNPENNFDSDGWSIFSAIFGWTNSATIGSVLSYVFYWIAVIAVLIVLKFREGRTRLFGKESAMGRKRRERQEARDATLPASQ